MIIREPREDIYETVNYSKRREKIELEQNNITKSILSIQLGRDLRAAEYRRIRKIDTVWARHIWSSNYRVREKLNTRKLKNA